MAAEERQRPGRATEEQTRRRRRGDTALAAPKRMYIPPEVQARLDRENKVPRWVNDVGSRIADLTQRDDYDIVEGVEPVPVEVDKSGDPVKAHLLAKPRELWDEDQREADARRKAVEKRLFEDPQGAAKVAGGANPDNPTQAPNSGTYIAKGTKIGRGNEIIEG